MQENNIREKCRELATRLYELDGEVYESVGSSLGRTFTGDREGTIRNLSALMYTKPDGHLLRSEMALISNMARTIKDKEEKSRLMKKYDEIFQEILTLPETFVATDIMDKERVALNHMIKRREKISENDHLVICISRTQGSAGNDIGFGLADKLRVNYYDVEIFDQVLRRLEAEKAQSMMRNILQTLINMRRSTGLILRDGSGNLTDIMAFRNRMQYFSI